MRTTGPGKKWQPSFITARFLHQAKKIQAQLPWEYTPGDTDHMEFALYRLLQEDKELASLGEVQVIAGEGTVNLPYEMNVSNLILFKYGDQGL